MIPVRLQISGFLSYQKTEVLDFRSFELACISGQNGAGKSSLLDAMTWALFGQARRKDDAIINNHTQSSNQSDHECRIIFDFEYEGLLYRIMRSKQKDKAVVLEFQVMDPDRKWKPLTEHTMRETEARVMQTLRMDYETFTNASFFLQGKADQFAQQKPADRKRILSSILGLEVWEMYRSQAAQRRKKLEDELTGLNNILEEIENELKEEENRKNKLLQLQEALETQTILRKAKEETVNHIRLLAVSLNEQKKMVDLLEEQARLLEEKNQQLKVERDKRVAELEEYRMNLESADQIEEEYHHWLADREKLAGWEALAADFHQFEAQRNAPSLVINTEKVKLEQELASYTEKAVQIVQIKSRLLSFEDEINRNKSLVQKTTVSIEQANHTREDLNRLLARQPEILAENKRLRQEMNELKERIDHLNQTDGAACPLCGQDLTPDDRQKLIDALGTTGRQKGNLYRSNQAQVDQINSQRDEMEKVINGIPNLELELRGQQRVLDQNLDQKKQMETLLEDWQQNGQKRLLEIESILSDENYARDARLELQCIDAELKKLGYDTTAHEAARKAEMAGRQSQEKQRRLETARAGLAPLERELERLEAQYETNEVDCQKQKVQLQTAVSKYEADVEKLPDLSLAEADLMNSLESENRIRMEVGAATQQVQVLKTLEVRREKIYKQRETFQKQVARIKILERAFGKDGIPALLIEQALPEIESQANEILDRLSEGGMSVSFSTQKDYKDKNREDKRETLDILISDAAGRREYEMFSGGEAFRVNFAIRLALSRVLAQRAGARLQTLVIDEGFGSQDAEGRQRLIQAINMVQPDFAKILVITHLEELKDVFPARIEVEKNQQGSSIKVIV